MKKGNYSAQTKIPQKASFTRPFTVHSKEKFNKKSHYNNNGKYKMIKPENVIFNRRYAFSLNPSDQPARSCTGKMKLSAFSDYDDMIQNGIDKLKYCAINLYSEISQNGRLHLHGYITIPSEDNLISFYFYDIPKLKMIGTFEIDTIDDYQKWATYVNKLGKFMKQWCRFNQIKYEYANEIFKSNKKDMYVHKKIKKGSTIIVKSIKKIIDTKVKLEGVSTQETDLFIDEEIS